jgi:ubiquinone/menaquinone biosynthesis C-methylase UbiE
MTQTTSTIVMPARHPVAGSFSLAGYRDVDAAQDPASYFAFLDSVAEAFAPMRQRSVEALRLRDGDAVLDMGCGHGASIELLAEQVGPRGRVVGLDASQTMLAEAKHRLGGRGLPVELHLGDAHALPFEDGLFDGARSDRVFMFLDDPQSALRELCRVTKTGGRVVVTEGDIGTHTVDASDHATTLAVMAALGKRSPHSWIGRHLRALFIDAGLADVSVALTPVLTTSYAEWSARVGIEACVSQAASRGELRDDAAQAWIAELKERDARGCFMGTALLFTVGATRVARRRDVERQGA